MENPGTGRRTQLPAARLEAHHGDLGGACFVLPRRLVLSVHGTASPRRARLGNTRCLCGVSGSGHLAAAATSPMTESRLISDMTALPWNAVQASKSTTTRCSSTTTTSESEMKPVRSATDLQEAPPPGASHS